jgi:uncharacterized protein with ParB-like and HNH nuclease domain/predicted transport protein
MKASEARLLELVLKASQFVIPIYQRTYSWTERECRQLWDDVIRAGSDENVQVHFVGSIVYVRDDVGITLNAPAMVIDGQQRLTTVMLMLAALTEALERLPEDQQEPIEGFTPKALRKEYLVNDDRIGDKRFKLLLTQTDRDTLCAILDRRELPPHPSIKVRDNFQLFRGWIATQGSDLRAVCLGIAKLMVVEVWLNRQYDNPQLIFESMNSTGKELSQADLIRNFVLMGLEPSLQTKLYEHYWRPMEVGFGQEAYGQHFDGFIRHFLTVRTGDIPNQREVYEAFKSYTRTPEVRDSGVEGLLQDLLWSSKHYCAMALGAEPDTELSRAFHDLRELRVDVAYPLLLEMYDDYETGVLAREDFLKALRLIESYVYRRAVCTIPTNSLNKTFSTMGRSLKKARYLESINAYFLMLPSYRRFPDDEEFMQALRTKDLYTGGSRKLYLLRRLENHGRKEPVPVNEYTIEHIMPQNNNLSAEWREALGPDWERVHHQYLHTLGNLTLTGYNSEYSDRPFREKRDMDGGFRHSPLRLNNGLGRLERWDEESIFLRGERLAQQAVSIWPMPTLSAEALVTYRAPKPKASTYTLDDHPQLASVQVRDLFEQLRKEVLALESCVTEEILKFYIAYKAETNFVDVIPQTKRLRLTLNMPFADLDDPRGVAEDVTDVGLWGNGDVTALLSSPEELPYIMGLIRQSLERQMEAVAQ